MADEQRGTRKFINVSEWLARPAAQQRALAQGDSTGYAAMKLGSRMATLDYTREDVAHLRTFLLESVGMEGLNPLDRSRERLRRLRTAVETWVRIPSNHQARLIFSPELVDRLMGEVGLGVIDSLLDDPTITEIKVAAWNEITIEQQGQVVNLSADPVQGEKWRYASPQELLERVSTILSWAQTGLSLERTQARIALDSGARMVVTGPTQVGDTSCSVVIRRPSPHIFTLDEFVGWNTLTPAMGKLLAHYVRAGVGMFLSGSTGSGKTTLFKTLLGFVPPLQAVLLLQETEEIQREAYGPLVTVIMRRANPEAAEGEGAALDVLADGARTLGQDRVHIGEVRGKEAAALLDAVAGGSGGAMCTLHAEIADDTLGNFLGFAMRHPRYQGTGGDFLRGLQRRIANSFPVVVHMSKYEGFDAEGRPVRLRYVDRIFECAGVDDTGQWLLHIVAEGKVVQGRIVWTDVAPDYQHVERVETRLAAVPLDTPTQATPQLAEEQIPDVHRRSKALDLLAQAEDAERLANWEAVATLLDQAAGVDPHNSVILSRQSEVRERRDRNRETWLSKLQSLTSRVYSLMETGDVVAVRSLLPMISGVEIVHAERDALLAEIADWLEEQERRWQAIPESQRAAVQQVLAENNPVLIAAWAERFFRERCDPAAQLLLAAWPNGDTDPLGRRLALYRELLEAAV